MARKPNPCPCGARYGTVRFECVACCIRWLSQMSPEEMKLNAPVIGIVAGQDQLDAVREAYKIAKK